jgi:hypothetical protein
MEGQTIQWPKHNRITASDFPLLSFGHCVVCPSFDLRLLIVLCYLLAIVLSVLPLIYGFSMAKRYQRAIRSRKSKEGQTTQWPKDTKGQSEAVNQRKDRQHNGQTLCCLSFL